MDDIKVVKIFSTDDCVKMLGGKCKGCEGVIVKVMKLFCSVSLTKDKKGTPVFSDKPNKVKREHIVIIPPPSSYLYDSPRTRETEVFFGFAGHFWLALQMDFPCRVSPQQGLPLGNLAWHIWAEASAITSQRRSS